MIKVTEAKDGVKVEMNGESLQLTKELSYATASLFMKALKDDMSEAECDEFWKLWRGAVEITMDMIRRDGEMQ